MTACGIFVKDILDAVPIDKYFEMFKPGSGHEGGFVRLKMSILTEEEMNARTRGTILRSIWCLRVADCCVSGTPACNCQPRTAFQWQPDR